MQLRRRGENSALYDKPSSEPVPVRSSVYVKTLADVEVVPPPKPKAVLAHWTSKHVAGCQRAKNLRFLTTQNHTVSLWVGFLTLTISSV